jgi:hypothetical protein
MKHVLVVVLVWFITAEPLESQSNTIPRFPSAEEFIAGNTQYGTLPWNSTEHEAEVFFSSLGRPSSSRAEVLPGYIHLYFPARFGITQALFINSKLVAIGEAEPNDSPFQIEVFVNGVTNLMGAAPHKRENNRIQWRADNGAGFELEYEQVAGRYLLWYRRKSPHFADEMYAFLLERSKDAFGPLSQPWQLIGIHPERRLSYDPTRMVRSGDILRVWARSDRIADGLLTSRMNVESTLLDVAIRCQTQEARIERLGSATKESVLVSPGDDWQRVIPNSLLEDVVRTVCR